MHVPPSTHEPVSKENLKARSAATSGTSFKGSSEVLPLRSLHSHLWIDGRPSANDTCSAISESGLSIFRGLSVSSPSTAIRLRFCAARMYMDDAYSEASTVFVDSAPFDISDATHKLLLDSHPPSIGDAAGEVFSKESVVLVMDKDDRKSTWCGSQYRLSGQHPTGDNDFMWNISEVMHNSSMRSDV